MVMDSSAKTQPTFSIVIPTYNSDATLRRCLDCLLAQQTTVSYEIIVSDDGSIDQTSELMAHHQYEHIIYLQHENVGRGGNRNIGAANASGRYLIFLDADMLPIQKFLASFDAMRKQIDSNSIISGAIPVAEERAIDPIGRFLIGKWERRLEALRQEPDNVFYMQSGNFCIHKSFFETLNGFDTSFRTYGGEDTDFFARAALAGARFYYSEEAIAYHLAYERFSDLVKKHHLIKRSSANILQRYPELTTLSETMKQKSTKKNLKGQIWTDLLNIKWFCLCLFRSLPIVERIFPDRYVFFLYNSLLSRSEYVCNVN